MTWQLRGAQVLKTSSVVGVQYRPFFADTLQRLILCRKTHPLNAMLDWALSSLVTQPWDLFITGSSALNENEMDALDDLLQGSYTLCNIFVHNMGETGIKVARMACKLKKQTSFDRLCVTAPMTVAQLRDLSENDWKHQGNSLIQLGSISNSVSLTIHHTGLSITNRCKIIGADFFTVFHNSRTVQNMVLCCDSLDTAALITLVNQPECAMRRIFVKSRDALENQSALADALVQLTTLEFCDLRCQESPLDDIKGVIAENHLSDRLFMVNGWSNSDWCDETTIENSF